MWFPWTPEGGRAQWRVLGWGASATLPPAGRWAGSARACDSGVPAGTWVQKSE